MQERLGGSVLFVCPKGTVAFVLQKIQNSGPLQKSIEHRVLSRPARALLGPD